MNIVITRQQLYDMEQELIGLPKTNPGIALILGNRIKVFLERTGHQSKIMHKRFAEIQEKWIEKDEHGDFLYTGEGETFEWLYLESYTDITHAVTLDREGVKKRFNYDCDQFFKQKISFEW